MLLIRADASPEIGTGHVMRCLALAQAWSDLGGGTVFVMAVEAPAIESRLKKDGFAVRRIRATPGSTKDAALTADLAINMKACFVVVDGYHFNAEYQKMIKDSGKLLLFLDDYGHAERYHADLVLNQNIYAREEIYEKRDSKTELLLGSPFILLRREFWCWRGWKRTNPKTARKVLISLGGSDPDNITLKIVTSLQALTLNGVEVRVVAGGGNAHIAELAKASNQSTGSIRLEKNVTNMPDLMAWADLAIISGGTTSWEAAFMGLPSLIVVIAENQVQVAKKLGETGGAVNLGWHHELTGSSLQKAISDLMVNFRARDDISRIGQSLVDGQGTTRVIKAMIKRIIQIRAAIVSDCELVYEWANEAEAREASFNSESITWDAHRTWFEEKLQDPNCLILICTSDDGKPFGVVRFDLMGDEAIMSINLDSRFRGRGLASLIIVRTVDMLFEKSCVSKVNAFIKRQNRRSVRAFERSGFLRMDSKNIKGNDAWHYMISREHGSEEISKPCGRFQGGNRCHT